MRLTVRRVVGAVAQCFDRGDLFRNYYSELEPDDVQKALGVLPQRILRTALRKVTPLDRQNGRQPIGGSA
jgi:hypothetical protein